MSGPRSPRTPMLKAYLMARPKTTVIVRGPSEWAAGIGAFTGLGLGSVVVHAPWWCGAPFFGISGWAVYKAFRQARAAKALPTPEQILAHEADAVVRGIGNPYDLNPAHRFSRLHRAFHPSVVEILEECAGYHARAVAALDEGDWSHRAELRTGAHTAANVAMDEALVLAGRTLPYAPEVRPLDAISDALEDVGFGPLTRRAVDPMPPGFRPARELAERLRELAVRCETAAQQHREASPEPVSAAFRHLDATIGEMRRIEEAEGELRQGT